MMICILQCICKIDQHQMKNIMRATSHKICNMLFYYVASATVVGVIFNNPNTRLTTFFVSKELLSAALRGSLCVGSDVLLFHSFVVNS